MHLEHPGARDATGTWQRELSRFAVVGSLGFVVDAGVVYLLVPRLMGPLPAQGIAFFLALTATWLLNRTFTFRTTLGKHWPRSG